jgi:hypothetical protein
VFLDAVSVVGSAILGLVTVVLSPVTAYLGYMADNVIREIPGMVHDSLTAIFGADSPITKVVDKVVTAVCAFEYGMMKFVANNLTILVLLALGPLTGGAAWVGVVGNLFIAASLMAEMHKGVLTGIKDFAYGFVINPFVEAYHGAVNTYKGIKTGADAFAIADSASQMAGGMLGVLFTAHMVKGWVAKAAPIVKSVAEGANMRLQTRVSEAINGRVNIEGMSPAQRGAVERISLSELSVGEKISAIREVAKMENPGPVLEKFGLEAPSAKVDLGSSKIEGSLGERIKG